MNVALLFQEVIGLGNCHHIHAAVLRQGADCGQLLSRRQFSGSDSADDLIADLLVNGCIQCKIQLQQHVATSFVLFIIIQIMQCCQPLIIITKIPVFSVFSKHTEHPVEIQPTVDRQLTGHFQMIDGFFPFFMA